MTRVRNFASQFAANRVDAAALKPITTTAPHVTRAIAQKIFYQRRSNPQLQQNKSLPSHPCHIKRRSKNFLPAPIQPVTYT